MKVKFYEATDYEEFKKDFGEGSILHMEALRLFTESKQECINHWASGTHYSEGNRVVFRNVVYELKMVRDPFNMIESLQFIPIKDDSE